MTNKIEHDTFTNCTVVQRLEKKEIKIERNIYRIKTKGISIHTDTYTQLGFLN